MTGFLAASLTWLVELKQNQKKSYNAGRYTSSYHKVGKKIETITCHVSMFVA